LNQGHLARPDDKKVSMLLSSRGLSNITGEEKTFVLRANEQELHISRFAAQFISPAIARALSIDPTLTSFSIATPKSVEYFEYISSLCEGKPISVPISRHSTLSQIFSELENDEMLSLLQGSEPVSTKNITERLLVSVVDSDLEFACEHFDSLNHSSLPIDILVQLLEDSRLKIESEDWLFGIIERLIEENSTFSVLLDYIDCEYLSSSSISRFISLISMENISSSIWSSICRRLSHSISPGPSNRHLPTIEILKDVKFDPDH
jgi:hypothetical protein